MGKDLATNRQTVQSLAQPSVMKSGSADNASLTVTHTAPGAGKRLLVTHCSFSFSVKTVEDKLAEIVEDVAGTPVVLWRGYTKAGEVLNVIGIDGNPIVVTANKTVTARLAASGGAGQLGVANIAVVTEKV